LFAVKEGVHLHNQKISPYDGDTFHEQPLFLVFYTHLLSLPSFCIDLILIAVDVLTAILLSQAVGCQLKTLRNLEIRSLEHLKPSSDAALLSIPNASESVFLVVLVYLLSPLSLLIVTARSSAIFSNLFIATLLWSCSRKCRITSCFFAALLTYQSLHFFPLFIAAALIIEFQRSQKTGKQIIVYDLQSILCSLSIFTVLFSALLVASYFLNNQSWSFVNSTYWHKYVLCD
jgi:phosphatidylinositol glycan class U